MQFSCIRRTIVLVFARRIAHMHGHMKQQQQQRQSLRCSHIFSVKRQHAKSAAKSLKGLTCTDIDRLRCSMRHISDAAPAKTLRIHCEVPPLHHLHHLHHLHRTAAAAARARNQRMCAKTPAAAGEGRRSIRCRGSHLHLLTGHAAAHMHSMSDRTNSNTACTFVVSFTESRVSSAPTHSLCDAK